MFLLLLCFCCVVFFWFYLFLSFSFSSCPFPPCFSSPCSLSCFSLFLLLLFFVFPATLLSSLDVCDFMFPLVFLLRSVLPVLLSPLLVLVFVCCWSCVFGVFCYIPCVHLFSLTWVFFNGFTDKYLSVVRVIHR